MGGLRGWNDRGQVYGSTESIVLAAQPQETAGKVNPKAVRSATKLHGKSRLQSRMSLVKNTARICIHECTQKRPEGN